MEDTDVRDAILRTEQTNYRKCDDPSDSNRNEDDSATPPPKRRRLVPIVKHKKIIRPSKNGSLVKELKKTNNTIVTLAKR